MSDRIAPLRLHHVNDPLPGRLPKDSVDANKIMAAHAAAVASGDPVYIDPATRRSVMTAVFLASRGRCCGSGCRHCPYEP